MQCSWLLLLGSRPHAVPVCRAVGRAAGVLVVTITLSHLSAPRGEGADPRQQQDAEEIEETWAEETPRGHRGDAEETMKRLCPIHRAFLLA